MLKGLDIMVAGYTLMDAEDRIYHAEKRSQQSGVPRVTNPHYPFRFQIREILMLDEITDDPVKDTEKAIEKLKISLDLLKEIHKK